jgi:hypothetical protein
MTQMDKFDSVSGGKKISPIVQATLHRLIPLIGEWTGLGGGGYPTLDDFVYSETFRVLHDQEAAYLTYEQRTELVDSDGFPIRKSHWEAGILRPLEDGSVELACVQGSGRVEVLRGQFLRQESRPDRVTLRFQSEYIGNDERVRSSSRDWYLTGDHFSYVMKMATTKVGEPTRHLEAKLVKKKSQG